MAPAREHRGYATPDRPRSGSDSNPHTAHRMPDPVATQVSLVRSYVSRTLTSAEKQRH